MEPTLPLSEKGRSPSPFSQLPTHDSPVSEKTTDGGAGYLLPLPSSTVQTPERFGTRFWFTLNICFAVTIWIACMGRATFLRSSFLSPLPPPSPSPDFTHLRPHCASIPPISAHTFQSRQSRLADVLLDLGFGAYITEPSSNSRYFANVSSSDWRPSERPMLLVFTSSEPGLILLTPKFEATRSKLLSIPADVEYLEWAEDEDPYAVLARRLNKIRSIAGKKVALDDQMRLFVATGLLRVGLSAGEAPAEVRAIRERKTDEELRVMRCVNEATLLAIRAVRSQMHIGIKESEAKTLMAQALTDAGLASQGIFVTAQFGENAALPHGSGTDRTLGVHDFITFDVGGTLHGYWSDVTRTFALPESQIPSRHLELWDVVRKAQAAAIDTAQYNVPAERVDATARSVITSAGYGQYFTHRLGHGIGLEVHESPYLRGGAKELLQTGNTFSDEPGIYIEGEVGIRLEDCFVIGEDGKAVFLTERAGGAARTPWVP